MRIMSLLVMPILGLMFLAGSQWPSWGSLGVLCGTVVLISIAIARLYRDIAFQPIVGLRASSVDSRLLYNFIVNRASPSADMSVYVATDESGIVPAHDLFTARFDGQFVLVIGSAVEKR